MGGTSGQKGLSKVCCPAGPPEPGGALPVGALSSVSTWAPSLPVSPVSPSGSSCLSPHSALQPPDFPSSHPGLLGLRGAWIRASLPLSRFTAEDLAPRVPRTGSYIQSSGACPVGALGDWVCLGSGKCPSNTIQSHTQWDGGPLQGHGATLLPRAAGTSSQGPWSQSWERPHRRASARGPVCLSHRVGWRETERMSLL